MTSFALGAPPESLGLAMAMMEDGPSVALFVSLVVAVSVVAAIILPSIFRRLPLKYAVPSLALIGPVLGIIGSLIGTGAMTLSGHDIWYALLVTGCTGAAAIIVGLRLARPVARDLGQVASTVEAVADGDRQARTGIDRHDEVGRLGAAVDELSRSLARAEAERAAADEERSSVVSALSHDLRTPLASLLVSVEAMEDDIGDPSVHLRAMRGNVIALDALVDDVFLLARADSGSLALGAESLDLAELIDEAVEAVAPVALAKEVEVNAIVDGALPVRGDDRALGRVLRNLLDNAIRYSPEGGLVTIEGQSSDEAVRIAVIDDGTGFPEDFIQRAFDRFSQADDARSRPGTSGLGLAIAHTLISAHEGAIEILPGPGGFVVVEIPRQEAPTVRAGRDRLSTERVPTGGVPSSREREELRPQPRRVPPQGRSRRG